MGYALPLNDLTVEEKLAMIEEIWQSLATDPDAVPSPPWHADVLANRREQIAAGNAVFHSLDEVQARLEKLTE